MLSALLQKLESEHGISPDKGINIIRTIVQHLKENFPQVGEMIDSAIGTGISVPSDTAGTIGTSGNESSFEKLEDSARSKLGNIFGK